MLKIRDCRYNDIEEICRIMLSTDPFKRLNYTQDICVDVVLTGLEEKRIKVAEVDEKVVGFIIYRIFEGFPLGGYIRAIAVKKEFRKLGIGSKLMEITEKDIFKYRKNVFLLVSSFNKNARKFYEKRGYEYVGEIKDAIIPGESEIILRKRRK